LRYCIREDLFRLLGRIPFYPGMLKLLCKFYIGFLLIIRLVAPLVEFVDESCIYKKYYTRFIVMLTLLDLSN